MKKFYLLAGALLAGVAVNAQIITNSVSNKNDRNTVNPSVKKVQNTAKAEGDEWWANGFETPSEWAQTTGTGHTAGDWAIVNAIPSNITGQQGQYQWPVTFSGSTGNFALINSDLAGGTASQDAYFEFQGDIDLSLAGSAPMYLTFAEYYRNFYDMTYVEVSNDGGTTWTTFEANPESEVPVNTNCTAGEVEVVNITPAMTGAWSNNVRIRFHYMGQWDWFWGIDDVKIVEAWDNDMKLNNWYAATDITTSFGLDYYHIPASQVSFPGLTFGAIVTNNGGQSQPDVALNVTATGGYDESGTATAIAAAATDSLEITVPYVPSGLGTKTVNITTTMANEDAVDANNEDAFEMFLTQYEFSRDNNIQESSIGQISSQDAQPLKIGNVMEMFDDIDVTAVKLRLSTQAAGAVGSEYFAEIYRFNGVDTYEFVAETSLGTVANTTATWVTLPLLGGAVTLNDGDDILVVAGHFGGTDEVRFGLAQNTYEGSVLGFTAANELFQLTSPGAVMIRLIDDPAANVEELANNFGMSVYPNPANANTTVSFELNNEASVVLTVTDLAGKVVATQNLGTVAGANSVTVDTQSLTNGVYMVNLSVNGSVSTQKLVVRK
jgi:hypothetical protein